MANAADFAIRTVLEVVAMPASGSAWLTGPGGLSRVASVGEPSASWPAHADFLSALLADASLDSPPSNDQPLILGPVEGHFSSGLILAVRTRNSRAGLLFFTSEVPLAFDTPQLGFARRMAAHLGQYWAR